MINRRLFHELSENSVESVIVVEEDDSERIEYREPTYRQRIQCRAE